MAQDSPPPPPAGPDLLGSLRALRRSSHDRVVAGVCGGLARRLGVDPLLLRVVVAVLALFGGVGIVLYAVAWLFIPEEDAPASLAEQAIGRSPSRAGTGTVVLAVVLGVVVLGALIHGFGGWQWGLLLALALAGFLLLLERSRQLDAQPPPPPGPPPVPPAALAPLESPMTSAPTPDAPPDPTATFAVAPTAPPPPPPPGPAWGALPPPPPPPPVRRERSALFGITASLTLLAVGILGLFDMAGASVPGGAYWATALTVVGLGLVAGAWIGRSRMLIVVGVLLALGLGGALAVDNKPDVSHINEHPATLPAAGVAKDYKTGDVRYDLTDVDFTGLDTSLKLDLGVGTLSVIVPADVDVSLHASSGVGEVDAFGTTHGGFGNDVDMTNKGSGGTDAGSLRLDLSTGVGTVEVRRG